MDTRSAAWYEGVLMERTHTTHPWISCSGVPRCTTEDDVYKGMFIPRGTTIFANAW